MVAALASALGGHLVHSAGAPTVGIHELTPGGGGQALPLPEGTRAALLWDGAFIAGYGIVLVLRGCFLAPAMFRRQSCPFCGAPGRNVLPAVATPVEAPIGAAPAQRSSGSPV